MNQKNTAWHEFLRENPDLNIPAPDFPAIPEITSRELASREDFWQGIYTMYPKPADVINLNSGAVSCNSLWVEHAYISYYKMLNQAPSYYWLKKMEHGRQSIKAGLAELINALPEEIAILRNATEAINNLIFGIDLKRGDEVIACHQDYAKCVTAWKQRERRDGITVKWVDMKSPGETDEEIVEKYISLITEKTRLLHLTHVINWNGQVLPVKRIIQEAKKRNVEVLLDGAHSFGLLSTDVKDLGCDYFGTALHKWLGGPIPGGMLYISKEKVGKVWPLASSLDPAAVTCTKFEELSIQLMPNILGLGYAMDFYHWLTREHKEERLRYLRRHFTAQVADNPKIRFLTPLEEQRCCTIVNVSLEDWEPADLETELLKKYKIHISPVTWKNMKGIRITPNIYTPPGHLDTLSKALNELGK